jgi:AcrR family transcriptional regulator
MAATASRSRKKQAKPPRTRFAVDERRAQLVELGLARFSRQSYDDVSIDEIADAAGISKGLLYHYFPTKHAYYVAIVSESAKRMLARTTPDRNLPPLERAVHGLAQYLDYVEEHAQAYSALLRGGVGADKEVARIVDETREAFVTRILENSMAAEGLAGPALEKLRAVLRGWIGCTEALSLDYLERGVLTREQVADTLAKLLVAHVQVATTL